MESSKEVAVVMVPLPAQGHLNQLLHLSRLLSSRGIPVHYIGSPTHNRQARNRVHGWNPCTISNIYFHDFHLPPFPTPPPDPNAPEKFPSHLLPTFDASLHHRQPLSILLQSLSRSPTLKRIVVLHDPLMSFAAEEASFLPNAEAYCVNCISIFSILHFLWLYLGKPADGANLFPPDLPLISFDGSIPESFSSLPDRNKKLMMKFDMGNIYNTCEAIEGRFINLMAQHPYFGTKRKWAVGPLNPVALFDDDAGGRPRHKCDDDAGGRSRHKCLEWLDKQSPSSVIYVSFGTMTSLSDEQIMELAFGLERSKQKFIWVLRDADRGDIYEGEAEVRKIEVPNGYEERIKGLGLIERDWAPQLEILAHSSTGGFMSHCGWNSCMESLSMGVPIAAWPMHSDQPMNSMLVTDVMRVGIVVREWASRGELVRSATIENAVRKLMVSEEGKEIRKRAEQVGISARQAVSSGGSSTSELDSFVAHVSR